MRIGIKEIQKNLRLPTYKIEFVLKSKKEIKEVTNLPS